jgi:hypothetical protein
MKWYDIIKAKYDIKDIDLQTFHIAGSKMKYFLDKHGSRSSAAENLENTWRRLITSILRHEKMRTKDRIDFKRVATAKGVNVEQSLIYDGISISGSKIIKPMFPIPLDITWWYDLEFSMHDYDKNNMVYGVLNINTEGSELLIRKITIMAHEPYKFIIDKDISIKKPDREIAKFIKDLQKDGFDVILSITTNMKYKNGTSIDIKPYLENFYRRDGKNYGKLMAKIRQDAALAEPKKTLFEERVEQNKDPRQNLWTELVDTYKKPSERWREEIE